MKSVRVVVKTVENNPAKSIANIFARPQKNAYESVECIKTIKEIRASASDVLDEIFEVKKDKNGKRVGGINYFYVDDKRSPKANTLLKGDKKYSSDDERFLLNYFYDYKCYKNYTNFIHFCLELDSQFKINKDIETTMGCVKYLCTSQSLIVPKSNTDDLVYKNPNDKTIRHKKIEFNKIKDAAAFKEKYNRLVVCYNDIIKNIISKCEISHIIEINTAFDNFIDTIFQETSKQGRAINRSHQSKLKVVLRKYSSKMETELPKHYKKYAFSLDEFTFLYELLTSISKNLGGEEGEDKLVEEDYDADFVKSLKSIIDGLLKQIVGKCKLTGNTEMVRILESLSDDGGSATMGLISNLISK